MDMLFVATPIEAIPHIGIGSGAVGSEQAAAKEQLLKLWKGVEQLIQDGKVGGAELCDLHPPVFIQIYEESTIKPISIQVVNNLTNPIIISSTIVVNLKSCCVVPEELSSFAKDNKVTLLTHCDPGELLPGDCLRNMLYPKLAREAGHYSADWVAR